MWLLNKPPFKVQSEALSKTDHLPHGFAYFMEMGLGKTAVLLADFMRLRKLGLVDTMVVFCPNSLKGNWAKEIEMWTGGSISCAVWPFKSTNADVVILNYESISGGAGKGKDFLNGALDRSRVLIGLDESTQIKNNSAVRSKVLLGFARRAAYTRILSGHPIVQGPQDLWSQLKFIGELRGVNYYQFRNKFCRMGGFKGKKVLGPNPEMANELETILKRSTYRAKKKDWLDIPEKMYYTRELELKGEQLRQYRNMLREFLVLIDGEEIPAHMVITQMAKLQQISSNFIYNGSGVAIPISNENVKLKEIKSILEEVSGRAIIVSYFKPSTELLINELSEYGAVAIKGGMEPDEIEYAKKQFNEGDARVIVCQESSAKYGHTLLGSKDLPCHTTILYENSFSLDDRVQIEDRNHRIGQIHTVNIVDLVCSPVEKKVIKALQLKQDIARAILDAVKDERI